MRYRTIPLILAVLFLFSLSGCRMWEAEARLDVAEEVIEKQIDKTEDKLEQAVNPREEPAIQPEDAKRIALEHAGLTADQVTYLHTEYEMDDGRTQYDVQFRQDRWEYEYEIDAQTGQILSYDRDD